MKKVAIYARYSTDLQNARSIDDQIRICRERAEREGWKIFECYTDHAISGASMMRAGLQQMLQDARNGKLDIILVESLDRLSRDQADIAAVFKHMQFAGIEIITLCEGRVGILDIGLRGTMNQLYLVETANKVRRGQHGLVKSGKVAAGISYGYEVIRKFDAAGAPIKGERKINRRQAKIIRRIFREYAAGKSPRAIAQLLNAEGIPSPFGQDWNPATIHGNRHVGTGILNNEFYIGRLVWNRRTFVTNPDTGRRVYRYNPESAWIRGQVPWLRIVRQELWDKVKCRQQKTFSLKATAALRVAKVYYRKHFPKFLLSGLVKCGCCGSGFAIRRHDRYGCFARDNRGTCSNALRIGRAALEDRVLNDVKQRLAMDPERCAAFCEAYARRLKETRIERAELIHDFRDKLDRVEADYDRLTDAPKEGLTKTNEAELKVLIARHRAITRQLARADESMVPLETHYPKHVNRLVDALSRSRTDHDSYHAFRSQIGQIVLRPNAEGSALLVEVVGGPPERRRKPRMHCEPLSGNPATDVEHSRAVYFGLLAEQPRQLP
jgi:site-specific DNA recombinase